MRVMMMSIYSCDRRPRISWTTCSIKSRSNSNRTNGRRSWSQSRWIPSTGSQLLNWRRFKTISLLFGQTTGQTTLRFEGWLTRWSYSIRFIGWLTWTIRVVTRLRLTRVSRNWIRIGLRWWMRWNQSKTLAEGSIGIRLISPTMMSFMSRWGIKARRMVGEVGVHHDVQMQESSGQNCWQETVEFDLSEFGLWTPFSSSSSVQEQLTHTLLPGIRVFRLRHWMMTRVLFWVCLSRLHDSSLGCLTIESIHSESLL